MSDDSYLLISVGDDCVVEKYVVSTQFASDEDRFFSSENTDWFDSPDEALKFAHQKIATARENYNAPAAYEYGVKMDHDVFRAWVETILSGKAIESDDDGSV